MNPGIDGSSFRRTPNTRLNPFTIKTASGSLNLVRNDERTHSTSLKSFLCASLLAVCVSADAQTYPTNTVRIIVPFPAGGGNDSMGRILAQKLSEALSKQFIVDNRAGANGMVGSELVAKAPRDGYTLLV